MKEVYTFLRLLSDTFFFIGKILTLICLFVILGTMLLQVLMRYVFLEPLIWPEGLSKVMFIWMSYLAAGLVVRLRAHIVIDFLFTRFPRLLQDALKYSFSATMIFIVVIFTIYSLKFAVNAKAHIYELGMISEFWLWLSMPIAGLFMSVHLLFVAYEDFCMKFSSFKVHAQNSISNPK
jgi:TRAP-type C4-dicarboxylate transport system permease small subunit